MKYLYIDEIALSELISERFYQSPEFDQGKLLASFIRGTIRQLQISHKVVALITGDGGYIISPKIGLQNYIVFDLEEAVNLLNMDDSGLILILQKTLRFATKSWGNLKHSVNERLLSNNRAIVFPYPIGMQTELRIAIDRNPDEKRRSKRETNKALLVYKFGDSEGAGINEIARLTNFRKACDSIELAYKAAGEILSNATDSRRNGSGALSVTELQNINSPKVVESGLEAWKRVLTTAQLNFVESSLQYPHRIEGPAGTGKTLCLVLKSIKTLQDAASKGLQHRALFVAHSEATKKTIENLIAINDGDKFVEADFELLAKSQSIRVTTLQELCSHLLKREISESELVDRDAYESKMVQRLYAIEAVERSLRDEFASHASYLSDQFREFMSGGEHWAIAEMLQHEISVQIKGRADQDLGKYKKLDRLKNGMPVQNDGDKTFVFLMYDYYQLELINAAQFDTDDIVLSAISQLNTPIWRRRRSREGFDSIFIDETHLFNLNELSVFHRLTRSELIQPIAYSVDRSQALGDRGWSDEAFEAAFDPDGNLEKIDPTKIKSIFRCSPEIVDLAFAVTSSGATLFTNFHNPMTASVSAFTIDEERKSRKPAYLQYPSEDAMFDDVFPRAELLAREMNALKADVAIIAFSNELFASLQEKAKLAKKPVEVIKSRGDLDAVNRAKVSGRFILSAPEFVGGLEFSGVVLVGVDGGRVPPKSGSDEFEASQNFLNYAAHQRLYVAITRARFRVEILGNKARGISDILRSSVAANLLDVSTASIS